MSDIITMAATDSKDRFEFRGVSGHAICRSRNVNYWPFQIRAAQGHARQVVDERALYRSATEIYASERSADIHHAAFAASQWSLTRKHGRRLSSTGPMQRHGRTSRRRDSRSLEAAWILERRPIST